MSDWWVGVLGGLVLTAPGMFFAAVVIIMGIRDCCRIMQDRRSGAADEKTPVLAV